MDQVKRRIGYLLRQSPEFKQFLGESLLSEIEDDMSQTEIKSNRIAKGSRRSKMKETEEDDELLHDAEVDEKDTQFPILTGTPQYIKHGQLRPYQLDGVNWLVKLYDNGISGILADEMGLGKTLQSLTFLAYLKHVRGVKKPTLLIAPKSVLSNWLSEGARWAPSLKMLKFHASKEERIPLRKELAAGKFDVCLTTFEIALLEKSALKKNKWHYLVIDEAHRIKNENSSLSSVVRLFNTDYRLLVTGTPLQNNLHELWALLNFLFPEIFSSSAQFDEHFDKTEFVDSLHKLLMPFMLRRLKADVENLPPKVETKLFVGLSNLQQFYYKNILQRNLDALNAARSDQGRMRILNLLMQLRKSCNHPYLFDGCEPGPPFTLSEHMVAASGKMLVLDKLLKRLRDEGSRVLIFCQMTRMLDILEDYCYMRQFAYARIDGQTAYEEREEQIDEFNNPKSKTFLFLLSTRAGGLGINLSSANVVILYDSDWNPHCDLQAMDRAHRIGQKKNVQVYRFVTENTVEEKIVERADAKLYLDARVVEQGRLAEKHASLDKEEIQAMIRFGADAIFNATGGNITDEDIDTIIARGSSKTREMNEKLKDNVQHSLLNFSIKPASPLVFNDQPEAADANEVKILEGPDAKRRRRPATMGPIVPPTSMVAPSEVRPDGLKIARKEEASGDIAYIWGCTEWTQAISRVEADNQRCLWLPNRLNSLAGNQIVDIACGSRHTIVCTSTGLVYAWGRGTNGQLGLNSLGCTNIPRRVRTLDMQRIVHVAAGVDHSVAVSATGEVFSWGCSQFGQLGQNNTKTTSQIPLRLVGLVGLNIVQAACGNQFTILLSDTGRVYSCGRARYGQLGHGAESGGIAGSFRFEYEAVARVIATSNDVPFSYIACGQNHSIAISTSGQLYSWGRGGYGRLGHDGQDDVLSPKQIACLSHIAPFTHVACGYDHSIALAASGQLFIWGKQASQSNPIPKMVEPFDEMDCPKLVSLSAGNGFSAVVDSAGRVYSWGFNEYGGLGHGEEKKRVVQPEVVDALEGNFHVQRVFCGGTHSVVLLDAAKSPGEKTMLPADICYVCQRKDNAADLVTCENCQDSYHIFCVDPPLKAKPNEVWMCRECYDENMWCDTCGMEDNDHLMLVCDRCHHAFHTVCAGLREMPDTNSGDWFCLNCTPLVKRANAADLLIRMLGLEAERPVKPKPVKPVKVSRRTKRAAEPTVDSANAADDAAAEKALRLRSDEDVLQDFFMKSEASSKLATAVRAGLADAIARDEEAAKVAAENAAKAAAQPAVVATAESTDSDAMSVDQSGTAPAVAPAAAADALPMISEKQKYLDGFAESMRLLQWPMQRFRLDWILKSEGAIDERTYQKMQVHTRKPTVPKPVIRVTKMDPGASMPPPSMMAQQSVAPITVVGGQIVPSVSRRKKRVVGEPNRPRTAYNFFYQDVVAQNMVAPQIEDGRNTINRQVGQMWAEMPAADKQKWKDMAAKDRQRYVIESAEYERTQMETRAREQALLGEAADSVQHDMLSRQQEKVQILDAGEAYAQAMNAQLAQQQQQMMLEQQRQTYLHMQQQQQQAQQQAMPNPYYNVYPMYGYNPWQQPSPEMIYQQQQLAQQQLAQQQAMQHYQQLQMQQMMYGWPQPQAPPTMMMQPTNAEVIPPNHPAIGASSPPQQLKRRVDDVTSSVTIAPAGEADDEPAAKMARQVSDHEILQAQLAQQTILRQQLAQQAATQQQQLQSMPPPPGHRLAGAIPINAMTSSGAVPTPIQYAPPVVISPAAAPAMLQQQQPAQPPQQAQPAAVSTAQPPQPGKAAAGAFRVPAGAGPVPIAAASAPVVSTAPPAPGKAAAGAFRVGATASAQPITLPSGVQPIIIPARKHSAQAPLSAVPVHSSAAPVITITQTPAASVKPTAVKAQSVEDAVARARKISAAAAAAQAAAAAVTLTMNSPAQPPKQTQRGATRVDSPILELTSPAKKRLRLVVDDTASVHSGPVTDDEADDGEQQQPCQACRRTSNEEQMVVCDACESTWHAFCLQPPVDIDELGDSAWYCPRCAVKTR